jgi:hypothetical protein
MKGNKKILLAIALLLLMSATFTTLAIYRSTASATGTINAARWNVKVNTQDIETATLTAAIVPDSGNVGKAGTMAPSDKGTVTYEVDATESDVPIIVEASVDPTTLPSGFTAGTPTITYGSGNQTATVVVEVTWSGAVGDDETKDNADKALKGTSLSVPITLTVRQRVVGE